MNNVHPLRLLLSAALLVIGLQAANAQVNAPAPTTVVMKVKGLTSADRDAIARNADRGMRLAFACVPAGILVFEGDGVRDRSAVRDQAMQRTLAQARRQDITELTIGRNEAEEQCAAARNR